MCITWLQGSGSSARILETGGETCYGVTTNRENSIEFDGLGRRTAGVGGSAARRHDPLAPEPLDFHETSIEFDPTCDLVVVFPVPLHVAGPSRLPAVPPSSSRRPSASRPSAPRPSSPVVASPPAHSTRSRRPSVPPAASAAPPVTPPSASQKTPKSSLKKSKGKSKGKEVAFNDGDVEGEDTQRAGPSAPRLSLVHPRISLDVRIPEDEKEFATYRSLVLGLTTQLEAARNDTSLLLNFSSRQANALNNLTAALVDVVNAGALDDEARTRLADVSRRSLTEIADVRRRLFDTPFLVTPMAYEPPPSLDWLGRRSSSRVPASAQTALDLLSLPFECLRTIRSLWRTPSMQAARDVQDFGDFFGAMNRAWNASLSTAFPSETLDLPSVIGSLHTNPAGPSRSKEKGKGKGKGKSKDNPSQSPLLRLSRVKFVELRQYVISSIDVLHWFP
ncbi:hypothetical protein TREMEDRAFT_62768 [Tremella mesenterica DSM 1558]|uniref:uncharacterized protein n=1 Tax=Tremella mesenterica (strain ATCC 24925 / CBS 8224 / DSM 1558 / NBRC 9311 / NRRL Y-6157 / RJB 2259-6 / UBC 559-6) TaxID=578456 RepID=UPI0003F49A07|nr:uncharacterized protein TREMEDRAFT_62768 [Tremella mesenterica DSM 1558]EIW69044.1 hypothetical protein TREMEDRAFT_62768 [Tremella mesenterica DSM 1558]